MKKENTGFKKLKKSGKVWVAIATFAVVGMGTVSVNADGLASETDIVVVAEPTTPPVTEEPTDPTTPPVTEEPTEPTEPPVTEEPTDPGTTEPGTTEPTTPPVTEEPTTSNTGKDSKPEKPNKGNSTPVFIPTAEKPLVTEGKNEIVGIEGSAVLVKLNDKVVRATANEVGGTVLDNGDIQVKNDKGEVKTLPHTSESKSLLPVVGTVLMILAFVLYSKKQENKL
ncbi:LPXTG cell wall anchor domain-containing protein [Streptococcus parauberis]|uniref:LPXTG cell wall anchor domain-containing protein n=1 Tax=Streptococcus parauberis TaxID=1348 RepID=UPI0039AFD15E